MKQYQEILEVVLEQGTKQSNRTGVDAINVPSAMFKHDMTQGFPLLTTKKMAWRAIVGELIGFLRGYQNAADFRALGCSIWDANANENKDWLDNPHRRGQDDLGRIYGAQWRGWRRRDGLTMDQLAAVLNRMQDNPKDRRLVVSAWRPDELEEMALPPCHMLFQFCVDVERKQLSLNWIQRSVDAFLGLPFNIASYGLLLEMVANLFGYTPKYLTGFLSNVHLYENHVDQAAEQMSRMPLELPEVEVYLPKRNELVRALAEVEPHNIELIGYRSYDAIKAPMAV